MENYCCHNHYLTAPFILANLRASKEDNHLRDPYSKAMRSNAQTCISISLPDLLPFAPEELHALVSVPPIIIICFRIEFLLHLILWANVSLTKWFLVFKWRHGASRAVINPAAFVHNIHYKHWLHSCQQAKSTADFSSVCLTDCSENFTFRKLQGRVKKKLPSLVFGILKTSVRWIIQVTSWLVTLIIPLLWNEDQRPHMES